MAIDPKKYTRAELAKMVEDTEEMRRSQIKECHELAEQLKSEKEKWIALRSDLVAKNQLIHALEAKNASLTEQISQMNGEAVNKVNEIVKLKLDADDLRTKLADTEAALGRANACIATMKVERDQQTKEIFEWQGSAQALHDDLLDARERANYAESHPWRNLWEWVKRKLVRHE